MTTEAVRFQGVAKRYPHFTLDAIDLVLPHGQIMGFIGANGAGKSTTIRILMGLVRQDRGTVQVLARTSHTGSGSGGDWGSGKGDSRLGAPGIKIPRAKKPLQAVTEQNTRGLSGWKEWIFSWTETRLLATAEIDKTSSRWISGSGQARPAVVP